MRVLLGTIQRACRFRSAIADALKQRHGPAARTLIMDHVESVKKTRNTFDERKTSLGKVAVKGGGPRTTMERKGGGHGRVARPAGTVRGH